jgi:hypothetical protein
MIMNVRSALESAEMATNAENAEIELNGWIVIIDDDLYIIDEDFPEDYKQASKIRLADRGIIYALCGAILPLGGGESFVFHRAKVVGVLQMKIPLEVIVTSLFIQERGSHEYVAVDITAEAINAGKARYEAALNFDFFKEMGDT